MRQKIFFERTKEMEETVENFRKLRRKVKSAGKTVVEKVSNPKKTLEEGKEWASSKLGKAEGRIKKYKEDPSLMGQDLKKVGKKAVKYVKENPMDAVYLTTGSVVLPALVKKKYGVKAAGTVAALPIGEALVGANHLLKSEEGKTALKAGGQVVKGVGSDIIKKVKGGKKE